MRLRFLGSGSLRPKSSEQPVWKRYVFLFLVSFLLLALPRYAVASCTTYTEVAWQWTQWGDGSITYMFLGMNQYSVCDVDGGTGGDVLGPGSDAGGSGSTPIPPSISIVYVNTTDPYNPIVAADVASNDPDDPLNVVNLEVNGATVDYSYSSGTAFGRYPLRLTAISNFSDGNVSITAKACSGTGVCAQNSANMNRFTPSPGTASSTIYATWLEEDEGSEELGPVYIPRSASYSHGIRQLYTTTVFTCSEIGESSHYQVKDSLVTISGQDPMPVWGSTVEVRGTISWWISYRLTESANPVGCTFPVICSSKAGGVAGAFGYAPSVHEVVSPFTIDGQAAVITNGSVDITFQ